MRLRALTRSLGVLIGASMFAHFGYAQTFPTKPVRIIVPLEAGGGGDLIARVVGQKMGEGLKQTVIVENRPGASTIIGTELVARSAPDGYTLVMATSSHAINPSHHRDTQARRRSVEGGSGLVGTSHRGRSMVAARRCRDVGAGDSGFGIAIAGTTGAWKPRSVGPRRSCTGCVAAIGNDCRAR